MAATTQKHDSGQGKNTLPSTSQNTKALSSSLSNPETTKSTCLYNKGVIQKYQ
jgi:hypothetical protein